MRRVITWPCENLSSTHDARFTYAFAMHNLVAQADRSANCYTSARFYIYNKNTK